MAFRLEYPTPTKRLVRRGFSAFPAFLVFTIIFFVSFSPAQNNGSSSASSGHSSGGSAPSYAAAAPASHAPASSGGTSSSGVPHSPTGSGHNGNGGGHNNGQPPQPRPLSTNSGGEVYYYPEWYAVPVPYAADANDAQSTDSDADDDDADYQGGPTVFDRRGSGAASYVPPVDTSTAEDNQPAQQQAAESAAEAPPDPTVLIFKDGHRLEIEDYAIVGQTLYDLTPGHHRRIALSDLDLPATREQNEDNGVSFLLPSSSG